MSNFLELLFALCQPRWRDWTSLDFRPIRYSRITVRLSNLRQEIIKLKVLFKGLFVPVPLAFRLKCSRSNLATLAIPLARHDSLTGARYSIFKVRILDFRCLDDGC